MFIYIPKRWAPAYAGGPGEDFDLHDHLKAATATRRLPVQLVREDTALAYPHRFASCRASVWPHVADLVVGVAPGHRGLVAGAFLPRDATRHDRRVHGHPTPGLGEAGALENQRCTDPAGGDDDGLGFDLEPVALAGPAYAARLATFNDEIVDACLGEQVRLPPRPPIPRRSTSPRSGNRACTGHRT